MVLPPRLEKELEELRSSFDVEIVEDSGFINVVFRAFALGPGYRPGKTDLLVRVPRSYPDAGPDMFWTGTDVALESGGVPLNADSIEPYLGKQWRRFSWHRAGWNPNVDNLHSNMEFIRRRLREKK